MVLSEAQVAIAIAADPRRAEMAEALAAQTGGHIVWDEKRSEWDTHCRAWRWCHEQGSDWGVVLQDDAVPVDGVVAALQTVLTDAPQRTCIGLYVGRSRPPQVQGRVSGLIDAADASGARWLRMSSLCWGVGVALPTERILPALAHRTHLVPYDERIGDYCHRAGLPVYYTWPSLVDHADTETLLVHADGQPRTEPRRAWRVGIPGRS